MRPLERLPAEEAKRLRGVVFDLDDTLLDHGRLGEAAYSALFRLQEVGLLLVACTGRPAGWGEVIQRQWPIDATVAENGAVAFVRTDGGLLAEGALEARRSELVALAGELTAAHPAASLADDNSARWTDVMFDIGEHWRVPPEEVQAMRAFARGRGVRTLESSVHMHLTYATDDKASGVLRLLAQRLGEDPTRARARWAFVGDSANDAAAFAAFGTTFGVANVRRHAGRLTVPPRYVAGAEMGRGFAEIAARIAHLRLPS